MNIPFYLISKVLYTKVVFNYGVIYCLQLGTVYHWHTLYEGEAFIHWNDEEPTSNAILEFIPCSFKKGCLLDSCSFILDAMMCTIICQWKVCGNISAETSYDCNFNKKSTNNDDSDDDCEDGTFLGPFI